MANRWVYHCNFRYLVTYGFQSTIISSISTTIVILGSEISTAIIIISRSPPRYWCQIGIIWRGISGIFRSNETVMPGKTWGRPVEFQHFPAVMRHDAGQTVQAVVRFQSRGIPVDRVTLIEWEGFGTGLATVGPDCPARSPAVVPRGQDWSGSFVWEADAPHLNALMHFHGWDTVM